MKAIRLKQNAGSFADFEPTNELKTDQMLITIHDWNGNSAKTARMYLNLLQIKQLFDFLDNFIQTKKNELRVLEDRRIQRRFSLKKVYHSSEQCGRLTHEHLLELKQMDLSIAHLLAEDLDVPVQELYSIIEFTPLPFALLKKHFKYCEEHLDKLSV